MQIEKTGQRAAKWRLPCFMLQRKDPAPRRRSGSLQELYKEEEESKLSRDLLEALEKQRNDLEQIAADAVIGNLKDGSVLVLVDSNDTFGILHTRKMLDCTGNAESDINTGTHGLTGLTNLMVGGYPTGVYHGAGSTYDAAHSSCQLLCQRNALFHIGADTAADGNNDLGAGEIH